MNFARVLETIAGFLHEKGQPYAVIGGVALAAYGLARTTLDLDLVLDAESQEEAVPFLESLGYETIHQTSGYSSHLHANPLWGRVDFLYVRGETSKALFEGCRIYPGPGGLEVPLPKPEHLAAMKALAIKNDPGRALQDMADVRFLIQLPKVDRQTVRAYFERHGLEERFDEIERSGC
jgi:hypothetical protein